MKSGHATVSRTNRTPFEQVFFAKPELVERNIIVLVIGKQIGNWVARSHE
jgi:hypothetical protein